MRCPHRLLFVLSLVVVPVLLAAQEPLPPMVPVIVPPPPPAPVEVPPVGEKIELRLRFEEGMERLQRQTADQRVELGPEETPVRLRYASGHDIRWTVLAPAPDGNARVRWTFERSRYLQSTPEGAVNYDSATLAGEPVPTVALLHAALVGQSLEATITQVGEVTAVDGIDALHAHLEAALAGLEPALAETLRASLETQFSASSLRETALLSLPILPDTPVATSETWGRQRRLEMGTPIDLNATYRLVERRDGKCLIESMARLATVVDDSPDDIGSGKLSLTLEGEQRGRLEVDEATGWITNGRYDQQLKGVSRIESPSADGDEGVDIIETPTRLHTVTSIESVPTGS